MIQTRVYVKQQARLCVHVLRTGAMVTHQEGSGMSAADSHQHMIFS